MKRLSVILAFFVSVIFSAALFAAEPVRVLTFNILASQPSWEVDAKQKPWADRKPAVLDVMLKYPDGNGPYDFIGTQETSLHSDPKLHQVKQLAEAMTGYDSLYAPCNGKERQFILSNMIFWKKDRWEIDPKDSGTYWLSSTPDVPGSNDWSENNKGGQRCVTYGLFYEIKDGKRTGNKVYFYNTHLNVHVPDARTQSAFLIIDKIKNRKVQDAAVIVTGDFNSRRTTPPYLYLTGKPVEFKGQTHTPPFGLTESYESVYPNDENKPGIDFIFVKDDLLKPVAAKRILTKKDGVQPSDHFPIDAVIEFK
ncbi:MAG: endonuclease/exonuclease/phosphatase family protein [Planctomycetaceae bacterium]|jgi:endonuclease/exonuclease/phosphatase family metal-dependent hydrolase|nr:endonuclease/exonuclease/phosphatase family protein [Planctomycetaceae bacterium]